jgi:hypothetical protein
MGRTRLGLSGAALLPPSAYDITFVFTAGILLLGPVSVPVQVLLVLPHVE